MTAYQLLLNHGEVVVPAGTASLLIATASIYTVIIRAVIFGERPARRQVAGGAVAFGGVALIAVGSGGVEFRTAALIVLAAAVAQGVYHAIHKPLLARYTAFEVTCYAMWAGTLFTLPWIGTLVDRLPSAGAGGIAATLYLGIVPSAIGFVTWAYAVGRLDTTTAASSLYLVPVVAIIIAFVWLGEHPPAIQVAGGSIAIAGVIVGNATRRRNATVDALRPQHVPREPEECPTCEPGREPSAPSSRSQPTPHNADTEMPTNSQRARRHRSRRKPALRPVR
jgi:drug/metabolite transporter (DMT)-like permease